MSRFTLRKPLAAAAILATSVGAVLATSGVASATTWGPNGNPVTVTANGTVNVIGGGTVALPAGARDVSWSGQGGRFAFIGADKAIYTADFDGTHIVKIAQGADPAHTVWNAASTAVYWTEGTGTAAKIVGAWANGSSVSFSIAPWDIIKSAPAGLGLSYADVAADDATSIVVQTTGAANATGVAVRSYDANGAQVFTQIVAPGDAVTGGSQPTISPDAKTVVFVRHDANGDAQLFASQLANGAWSKPAQITFDTGLRAAPIFEGDGAKPIVAYGLTNRSGVTPVLADGTYTVDVTAALAAGKSAGLETKVSDLVGGVAVRTDAKGYVTRFPGVDRFDTAIKASTQLWRTAGAPSTDWRAQAGAVVLSRSDEFADALGGSALAAHKNAPLLLTETASLNPATQQEVQRVLPAGGTVYVLGGEAAVSRTVTDKLGALGYKVVRIAGADRFETSVNIANTLDPNASDILVATGTNYPDALSAGAAAGTWNNTVVVLTNGTTLPTSTADYLMAKYNNHQLNYFAAVGGPANAALANAGWTGQDNLGGADRYETSLNVAKEFTGFNAVGLATGTNWPDSLSGGALLGYRGGPLLLVDPVTGLSAGEHALLDANRGGMSVGYVFGGTGALPAQIDDQLAADVRTASGVVHTNGYGDKPQDVTPNVSHS